MSDRPPAGMISMPREVVHLLLDLPGEADMETLRAVGDAGGGVLLDAFAGWSRDAGVDDLAGLPLDDFRELTALFLRECGWGDTTVAARSDSLVEVTVRDCWETQRHEASQFGCHLTTGLLHGFFAGLAGYELGVMELECAGLGSGRECRFVIGTPEMVDSIYAGLSAGESYEEVTQLTE
ncbi:MAG TPA: V4R domain-containing protein [Gemmatimonadaceae bacterium]|nr:V4R domain-containing protein [Gemmatimonadaceae bacterium]